MKKPDHLTRRRFVGGMLKGVIAAAVAPRFLPVRLLAGEATPSKQIHLAHIGVGAQGTGNLRTFLSQSDISTAVAICDPFKARRDAAGEMVKAARNQQPKLYNDFREVLADPAVDACVITTPDHWHVPIGLAAVRAGKDVYIEKPLGYTLNQNKAMLAAVHEHKRIFQYGTQQRSSEIVKRGVELVINGYIGDLERVLVWAPGGSSGGSLEEIPVPEGLDYEMYIGPAPMRPCSKDRITNSGSYFCSDYSLGFIAGWGAHPLDIFVWACDADKKGPYTVKGTGVIQTPDALFNTYNSWDMEIRFSNGLPLRFMSTQNAAPLIKEHLTEFVPNGTTFFGSKGWINISRGRVQASNPEWIKIREPGEKRVVYNPKYYKGFAETVRDRSASLSPIEDALRSDAISHLSVLALRNNTEVVWDPHKYEIVSPAPLNAQMNYNIRGDWKQS